MQNFTAHLSSSAKTSSNMASDQPREHNNDSFKLANVFDVKGKVALITGKSSILHHFEILG